MNLIIDGKVDKEAYDKLIYEIVAHLDGWKVGSHIAPEEMPSDRIRYAFWDLYEIAFILCSEDKIMVSGLMVHYENNNFVDLDKTNPGIIVCAKYYPKAIADDIRKKLLSTYKEALDQALKRYFDWKKLLALIPSMAAKLRVNYVPIEHSDGRHSIYGDSIRADFSQKTTKIELDHLTTEQIESLIDLIATFTKKAEGSSCWRQEVKSIN